LKNTGKNNRCESKQLADEGLFDYSCICLPPEAPPTAGMLGVGGFICRILKQCPQSREAWRSGDNFAFPFEFELELALALALVSGNLLIFLTFRKTLAHVTQ
jgi:hypothetical protein